MRVLEAKLLNGTAQQYQALDEATRTAQFIHNKRRDWAVKLARCVVVSNDIVVHEDLQVRNLVRNHHLAKAIHDASWFLFRPTAC